MSSLSSRMMALARLTLQDPRAATRALLAEDVPLVARTAGLILIAVVSTLLLQPSFALLPPEDAIGQMMAQSPLQTAILQWLALLVLSVLIYRVGAFFGGKGSLADSLLIVVWLQFLLLGVQLAQLVALVLVPPLAPLIGLTGFALSIWLLVNFVAELHGFRSLGRVFLGIAVTFLLAVFVIALLLGLFLGPEVLRNA